MEAEHDTLEERFPAEWRQQPGLRPLAWAVLLILIGFLLADAALRFQRNELFPNYLKPSSYRKMDSLVAKQQYYLSHKRDFDLLFLGDSRTYCGLHPEFVDHATGFRSFNLSSFAHWFPTQFGQLTELLPDIPADTTIVWSIGSQNFAPVQEALNKNYPLSLPQAWALHGMGFPWSVLQNNTLYGIRGLGVYSFRRELRSQFDEFRQKEYLSQPRGYAEHPSPLPPESHAPFSTSPFREDRIRHQNLNFAGGNTTSRTIYLVGGGYVRQEYDRRFFRAQQAEHFQALDHKPERDFTLDPAYWKLFLTMLDMFEHSGLRLLVQEFTEAPAFYADQKRAKAHARVMAKVQDELTRRSIPLIRIPWEQFSNDDFFDYNHLNLRGIEKFSPLFVQAFSEAVAHGVR